MVYPIQPPEPVRNKRMTILSVGCKVRPLYGAYRGKDGTVFYYNPWRKTYTVYFEGESPGGRGHYENYEAKDLEVVK